MGVSVNLLIALGIVFVLQLIIPPLTGAFIFDPALALSQPWRFVTSMFLHADPTHIFFNGFALLMFGPLLERKVSARDFLIIYFGAGLLGGLLYYLTYAVGIIPPIPALGASGAIYGILGACAVLFPDVRIFFMGIVPMSMRTAAVAWFLMEFLGTFSIDSGVASAAHLGGLIFGLACAWYLRGRKEEQPFAQYSYPAGPAYSWQNEA
ncbi:MAG: rhomboid family intramembrane serine protease [Candidatus ainarchaeum sp.]|nr:rhomboid family intramembrane serine protease [Candidatus ainarchaeum sp.]